MQNDDYVNQYASRDILGLDEKGNYYSKHVSAMTREGLHSKSDIAAELAFRDARIEDLTLMRLVIKGVVENVDNPDLMRVQIKEALNEYKEW
jgi:hypothetical protein